MGTLTALPAASDNPLLEASPGLMIWTLVIFGITLFILKRYVFGPVGDAIEKRRRDISESIEEAEPAATRPRRCWRTTARGWPRRAARPTACASRGARRESARARRY